ncbi:hypothetical protein [Streptomyces sp. NPDC015345]|uniref:hypothetical protein n=1 Tax=Streptomyces sp. NPDC015345 TaxID=3364953 RepID=UPI0036F5487B
MLQAGAGHRCGERAAGPVDDDDLVVVADDERGWQFPALSGELGVDLEADGGAGQGALQLVAQIEDDGEVGLDRSKSDQDPAEWQPPLADARCTHTTHWVATKLRWGLTVDTAERQALRELAAGCGQETVEYEPAG